MKAAFEIERKFVIDRLPDGMLGQREGTRIHQGYLLLEKERELRIRKMGQDHHSMTVKQGQGLQRLEQECAISSEQFDMLWPLTAGRRLVKTRYCLQQRDHLWEIDVFAANLSPLVLLEVEFATVEQSREFAAPGFVAFEVTEDPAYKNAALATQGLPGAPVKGRSHE